MGIRLTIRSPRGTPYTVDADQSILRIGRAAWCDVQLPYPVISSHHLTLRRDGKVWQIFDIGSTNGTMCGNFPLEPNVGRVVTDGMSIDILDVRIEFDLGTTKTAGFTLRESGTLLRKMLEEGGPDESAFLEVLEGKSVGTRITVPDETDRAVVGEGEQLGIDGIGANAFAIARAHDRFRIEPLDAVVTVDGIAIGSRGHVLRSGDHLQVGATKLVWFDPLEGQLEELEEAAGEGPPPADPAPRRPVPAAPPPSAPPRRAMRPLERAILILSILLIIAATAVIVLVLQM